MLPTGRLRASPASSVPLAPRWAAVVALTALLAGSLLAALVWHATRLDPVDAWVMRWQELASAHVRVPTAVVSATLGPVALLTMVAGAALGQLVNRRDLKALALVAVPVTLAAEILLKWLVHRQWEGDPQFLFSSGHAAIASAAALTAVVAVQVTPVAPPPARLAVARLTGGYRSPSPWHAWSRRCTR